jgi:hypothetical protein
MEANERGGLGGSLQLQANKRGDLYIAEGLPKYSYLVNSGCCWQAKSATCAAVVAVPTTASVMAVQNGYGVGGLSAVVLAVGTIQIASPASMTVHQIIYSPQVLKAAAVTNSITPANMKPASGTYTGSVLLDDTATVVDNGWFPLGPSTNNSLASTPGAGVWVDVAGLLVIPPGGSVGFHCMASTTAVTVQLMIAWAEVQL